MTNIIVASQAVEMRMRSIGDHAKGGSVVGQLGKAADGGDEVLKP
jgi:hypothetical protein